ncbi:MAG: hypothetical protein RLT05_20190 [Bauldia litoralis]
MKKLILGVMIAALGSVFAVTVQAEDKRSGALLVAPAPSVQAAVMADASCDRGAVVRDEAAVDPVLTVALKAEPRPDRNFSPVPSTRVADLAACLRIRCRNCGCARYKRCKRMMKDYRACGV